MTSLTETGNLAETDLNFCERWMPSIDQDELITYRQVDNLYESNKEFFKIFQQKNDLKENQQIFLKFKDFLLFFDINGIDFQFKLQFPSKNTIFLDREILPNTKSPFILHPEIDEINKQELRFPFRFGCTLEQIIEQNKKNRFLEATDKFIISIQIITAIKDLYTQNESNTKYMNRKISDRSFFIDYLKNAYLFTISDDNMNKAFEKDNIKDQKSKDIYTIKILLSEIFREINPSDVLRSNQSYIWYHNHHDDLNKFFNRFNKEYKNFDDIIKGLKETKLYQENEKQINERLDFSIRNSSVLTAKQGSFFESMLSKWTINLDINSIYRQLFTQLQNKSNKEEYVLLFNIINHIFFPSFNTNYRSFDSTKLLEIFDTAKIVKSFDKLNFINDNEKIISMISSNLIKDYLPADIQFIKSLRNLRNESNFNEEYINSLINELDTKKLDRRILSEFKNTNDQKFFNFLKEVYSFYFPENENLELKKDFVFDYFGIINFLANKNDLIYITHPNISDNNLKRLKNMRTDQNLNDFIKKSFSNKFNSSGSKSKNGKLIYITQNIDGFDYSNVTNRLMFQMSNTSFYIERKTKYDNDDNKQFEKRVHLQDELFHTIVNKSEEYEKKNKLNTKYILKFDEQINQNKNSNEINSISYIPLFSCTLNQFIQSNSRKRIIHDSDKILWAIQIASSFAVLQKYEEEEFKNQYTFNKSIYDQFFYIDSMKNIYLAALAYNIECDNQCSTSNGPMYFRCDNDDSYIYKYGILLFEIFSEIEPKFLFGNLSRQDRTNNLKQGYGSLDLFNKYKEYFSNYYGDELGRIIDRCVLFDRNDRFRNFKEIIQALKETNLYKKYKYIIELREKEARPTDSDSFSCSFKSLVVSSIAGLRDINIMFEDFLNVMLKMKTTDAIHNIFTECINILKSNKSQEMLFNVINKISKRRFKGNIDDLFAQTVSRIFSKNFGKAIVIKESYVQNFGIGINDNLYFNYISQMISEGMKFNYSNETTFKNSMISNISEKVPILTLDYYLKNNQSINNNRWTYQMIYFLDLKGFTLSTSISSYEIKMNDFALFYNNKTDQFDVDLLPILASKANKMINVFSFATLVKQLLNINVDDQIDINDIDSIDSINEFISFCYESAIKSPYQKAFYYSKLESILNNGCYFYDLLKIYEKELEKNVDEKIFNKIIDKENYQDENYKILHSKISKKSTNFLNDLCKNDDEKVLINYEENKTSGYYLFYEDDFISNEDENNDTNDEVNNGDTGDENNDFSDEVENNINGKILKIIFPPKLLDGLQESKRIKETVKDLLDKVNDSDELKHHKNTSSDFKFYLIMKIFPEKDPLYVYKLFYLKNKRIYKTLKYLIDLDYMPDYENYQQKMDIEVLFYNFPELMEKHVIVPNENTVKDPFDEIVEKYRDSIKKALLEEKNDVTNSVKKDTINSIQIEIPLSKEKMIDQKTELIINEIKEKIKNEISKRQQINKLSTDQKEKIYEIIKKPINSFLSSNKQQESMNEITNKNESKDKILNSFFELFFEEIEKISHDSIENIYKNKNDLFETTKYISEQIFEKKQVDAFIYTNYSEETVNKYKNPKTDKYVTRTLEITNLEKRTYEFLIKRYINHLNPKFNYYLVLKINNSKNAKSNITLDDLESSVRKLNYEMKRESGNIVLTIKKTL